jgi:hypothetical protein
LPTSGNFTVTASATELAAGLIIQYGFNVKGINANPANEQNIGSVVISATATSIQSLSNNSAYSIYPNPAQDVLMINGLTFENYRIFDILGQEVLSGKGVNQVDISKISAGQYIIEINANGTKTVKSFVKK